MTTPFSLHVAHAGDDVKKSIDRAAVIKRHNPRVTRFDAFSALSVGNGEFAFTADCTGLQTFPELYQKDFPLCTTAHWAWHTTPHAPDLNPDDFHYKTYIAHGRHVGYATDSHGQEDLFNWLRQNPHGMHLGRIGFDIKLSNGKPATADDVTNIQQTLDLWSGLLESRFEVGGVPVRAMTCCHPQADQLAARVESPLLREGRLKILLAFPYPSPQLDMADFKSPNRHETRMTPGDRSAEIQRIVDGDHYFCVATWSAGGRIEQRAKHEFVVACAGERLDFSIAFAPESKPQAGDEFDPTQQVAAKHWQEFWLAGGAIDLGDCTDPRAPELERRIVLSQYNTALHCAGSLPPAETGLLSNSWYGKFHLEMHWWHGVHFAAWNRLALFERSLTFYQRTLPVARDIANRQGYKGARWPKMVGPDGHDSPSPVGPLLIWQQPHPIYYAELCYRARPTKETLDRWQATVFDTAAFMADYAAVDEASKRYVLGPPMKTVSENTDTGTSTNPTFELAYWRFGLRVAQSWRERLGMPRDADWDRVLNNLAPLPMQDGLYLLQEGLTDTYTKWNWEHPALLGALGMQPGDGVDRETMRRTIKKVMDVWQWDRAWGWDFPMAAMCAARNGEPELAIQALMIESPKNRYHPNGHVYQRPNLTAYLPANGGLLSAIAMMAAGWTDGPKQDAPGFPADGKWSIKHEGLISWL